MERPGADALYVGVQEGLYTSVGRTETVAQQLVFLVVVAQQGPGDLEEIRVGGSAAGRLTQRGQFQVDVAEQTLVIPVRSGRHMYYQLAKSRARRSPDV